MKKSSNKGFTLVELIIVIAILAIIMMIAVPNFSGIKQRFQVRADKATAAEIGKAFTLWRTEYDTDEAFKLKVKKYVDASDIGTIATDGVVKGENDTVVTMVPVDADKLSKQHSESGTAVAIKYMTAVPKKTTTAQLHTVPYLSDYVDTRLLPTSMYDKDGVPVKDQFYWVGIIGDGQSQKTVVSIGKAGVDISTAITKDNVTYDGVADGIAYLEP